VRVLVLYVDRDGDLKQAGINTPVVGRDNVLRLGIQYILRHPDDSDANAIFAAVKTYDSLEERLGKGNVEVAVVCGSPDESVANLAVLDELGQVLSVFDADAIYFVSDGPSDEAAVMAVQTRRPVISVERVVVKQSRSVEETVSLIRYYLAKAVKEPEYRRYTVGIPSFLLFLYALSIFINISIISYILELGVLFLMFLLMMYGFGVYDFLKTTLRKYEVTFAVSVISLFAVTVYFILALSEYIGIKVPQSLSIRYDRLVPAVALVAPIASYAVEGFLRTQRISRSVFVLAAFVFSFFYFIIPPIVEAFGGSLDVRALFEGVVYFLAATILGIIAALAASRALPSVVK
jgi:Predicted membrane protein